MPLSCYRHQELYKHVKSLVLVDPQVFKNTLISNNLCICSLLREQQNMSYQELEFATYNIEYLEFYRLNALSKKYDIRYFHGAPIETRDSYNIDTDWMVTWYICNTSGAHKVDGDSFDCHYNIKKDITNFEIMDDKCGTLSVAIIRFSNSQEKNNFNRYWYYNPLSNKLIQGLNKTGGSAKLGIPNLNWNLDRLYETATLEDLMRWIKEDNHE